MAGTKKNVGDASVFKRNRSQGLIYKLQIVHLNSRKKYFSSNMYITHYTIQIDPQLKRTHLVTK